MTKKYMEDKNLQQVSLQQEIELDEKKKKRDYAFELVLFLILGFLIGVTIKTEAAKKITIGYNDYKISAQKQGYDFEKMKKDLAQKQQQTQQEENANGQQEITPDN